LETVLVFSTIFARTGTPGRQNGPIRMNQTLVVNLQNDNQTLVFRKWNSFGVK
jgi:hypothetical protein